MAVFPELAITKQFEFGFRQRRDGENGIMSAERG
jgi:hypothetical protein